MNRGAQGLRRCARAAGRRTRAAQHAPLQADAPRRAPAYRRPRVCRCSLANAMPSSVRGWLEWGMTERMPQSGLPLVLLAGDGKEATRWLRVLLEGGGYAVLQERTGQHGLERAGTTEPDVILVDADLPDMAGVELCRMLRADPRVSSSTPILLTIRDASTREQRLAALRAGAWECIAPPHDAEEILLKIGAYVHAKLDADRARAGGLLDPVTGLYNRQGLARRARELGSQAFREHGPLACIVLALDVEPPSGVNLGRSVQAIKAAARLSDVIGRLGGRPRALRLRGRGECRLRADRAGGSVGAGGRGCPDRQSGFRYLAAALRRSSNAPPLPRFRQEPASARQIISNRGGRLRSLAPWRRARLPQADRTHAANRCRRCGRGMHLGASRALAPGGPDRAFMPISCGKTRAPRGRESVARTVRRRGQPLPRTTSMSMPMTQNGTQPGDGRELA